MYQKGLTLEEEEILRRIIKVTNLAIAGLTKELECLGMKTKEYVDMKMKVKPSVELYVDANIENYLTAKQVKMLRKLINNNQILPAKLTNSNDDVLYYCISDAELLDEVEAIQNNQSSLSKQEQELILKIKTQYSDAYDKKSKRHIRFFFLNV